MNTEGALDAPTADGTSGRNLAVVSYELEATPGILGLPAVTNTAQVTNFSATEGGPNFVPIQPAANMSNDAVVTPAAPSVVKTIVGTNQDFSTGTNVAIGEVVQYEVSMPMPEGNLAEATLVDTLPTGLAAVSVDSITASPGVSTSVAGGLPAVAAAAQASLAAPGQTVSFDFGDLVNADRDDSVDEQITITYSAVVLDVAGNQAATGLRNDAVLSVEGREIPAGNASVTVAEPDLNITKTPSPSVADAGDTVTYTIEVRHGGASGLDAFGVDLSDLIPPELAYVPGSLQSIAGPAPTTLSDAAAPTLTASWDALPLGQVARLQYQAVVAGSINATSVVENTAEIVWTSLPEGAEPESPFNPDGRERTGEGGVDDYHRTATASLQMGGGAIGKALHATSSTSTGNPNVTIGEELTYDVGVRLAEGTIEGLVITDVLPAGLAYVPGSVELLTTAGSGTAPNTLTADFNGNLPPFVVSGGAGDGDDVVVTFPGTTTVAPDNDPANNAMGVRLRALVLDVPTNAGVPPDQTVLANQATVTAQGAGTFASNQVANPVVEPRLTIVKSLSPSAAVQGDTIEITVAVTNTGTSTAFGVLVEDQLPAQYVAASVVEVTTPAGFAFNRTDSLISYQGGDIPAGETRSFVLRATLQPDLPAGEQVTNTATASTATSLPGDVPGERTVAPVTAPATLNVVAPDLVLTKDDGDTRRSHPETSRPTSRRAQRRRCHGDRRGHHRHPAPFHHPRRGRRLGLRDCGPDRHHGDDRHHGPDRAWSHPHVHADADHRRSPPRGSERVHQRGRGRRRRHERSGPDTGEQSELGHRPQGSRDRARAVGHEG